MKYIIPPILKIIWSSIFSVFATLFTILFILFCLTEAICYSVWEFNHSKWDFTKWDWEYPVKDSERELWSVYYHKHLLDRPYLNSKIKYKSIYHYIWGILDDKKLEEYKQNYYSNQRY